MTPKHNYDPAENSNTNVEEDLQEVEAVMETLDELGNAMDCFEQRADYIIEQLKVLEREMQMTSKDMKDLQMSES